MSKSNAALLLALVLAASPVSAASEGEPEDESQLVARLREVVDVRLGSEPLPQQVDMLGQRSHAEVMVSLPLTDSLRLRGGTRVQLHEQPAVERSELEAQPVFGIQLRF